MAIVACQACGKAFWCHGSRPKRCAACRTAARRVHAIAATETNRAATLCGRTITADEAHVGTFQPALVTCPTCLAEIPKTGWMAGAK